jgi:3-oxoacyl-[acyl-carrier protein] reductase
MTTNITSKRLTSKVAIVTGASKGIGASIAKHLAAEGASVVVNYSSSKAGADQVVDEISKAGGNAIAVQADVSKHADIDRLFAETDAAFGRLDILVNNAGIYDFSPLENITEDHFHKHFNLNVLGLILTTQAAVKQFGPEGGSIINISSVVTTITPPNSAVYTATKGAVDAITRTLARELGARNIRVNAINPGMIQTEGVAAAGFDKGDFRTQIESQTPLGRIGQPDDIAPTAVYLASSDSKFMTGETLVVSGGLR